MSSFGRSCFNICVCRSQQTQPKKNVLDHAGCTAPTQQHELNRRDIFPKNLDHQVAVGDLSDMSKGFPGLGSRFDRPWRRRQDAGFGVLAMPGVHMHGRACVYDI